MFKLAIEVCFENHFGLIHAIFLSLGSTKSGYFFLGHPVDAILQPIPAPMFYILEQLKLSSLVTETLPGSVPSIPNAQ